MITKDPKALADLPLAELSRIYVQSMMTTGKPAVSLSALGVAAGRGGKSREDFEKAQKKRVDETAS